jgi:hypothetical protein
VRENILGHKGDSNPNDIEIPPHPERMAVFNNTNNNKC